MIRSRTGKIAGVALVGLAVVAIVAWLALPTIAGRIVRRQLSAYGLSDVEVAVQSISPGAARVSRIVFGYPASEYLVQVEIDDIGISYGMGDLLDGCVDKVAISRLRVTLHDPLQTGSRAPGALLAGLALRWRNRFVLRKLAVHDGEIRDLRQGRDRAIRLAVQVNKSAAAIEGHLSLIGANGEARRIELTQRSDGRIRAALQAAGAEPAAIELTAESIASGVALHGVARLDFASLDAWLQPLLGAAALPVTGGRGQAQFMLSESIADGRIGYRIDSDLTALVGAGVALDRATLVVAGSLTDSDAGGATIIFDPASMLSLHQFNLNGAGGFESATVKWAAKATLDGDAVTVQSTPAVQVDVQGAMLGALAGNTIHAVLGGVFSRRGSDWSLRTSPDSRVDIAGVSGAAMTARQVRVVPVFTIDAGAQAATRVRLESASRLAIERLQAGDLRVPSVRLRPSPRAGFVLRTDGAAWVADRGALVLTAPVVQAGAVRVESADLTLIVKRVARLAQSWSAQVSLTTPGLAARVGDVTVPLRQLRAALSLMPDRYAATLDMQTAGGAGALHADLQHDPARGAGAATWRLAPVNLDRATTTLSRAFRAWPYRFDLVSGTIGCNGKARWSAGAPTTASLSMQFAGTGGNVEDVVFDGLDANLDLQLLPVLATTRSALIKVARVDYGVSLENLQGGLEISTSSHNRLPTLKMTDMSATLFNGKLRSGRIELNPNEAVNRFTVQLEGIDLGVIVSLHGFDGLKATGRLSGTLPVTLNGAAVSIDAGRIIAAPPGGTIQYAPPGGTGALEKAAPGAEILFRALHDFRYTVLGVATDYAPGGKLILGIQLEGTSPELDTRRPVHLNINVEQNVLALLKSLRLVEGIDARFSKRLQEHYGSGAR